MKVTGEALRPMDVAELYKEQKQNIATNKRTVLVVDDEPHIVNLVKMTLDDESYNVLEAYSAHQALDLVKDNNPDLIIVDLMMPGVNGYELCESLRESPQTKDIPIMILSAKGQMNDKLHAIDVGADDYITKPFDPQELVRRVKLNLGIAS